MMTQALLGSAGGFPVNGGNFAGGTVSLNADGTASGGSYSGDPAWFNPPTVGVGSKYWARTTRTGGTGGVSFNPASGSWYSLASGQLWSATGAPGGCTGTLDIASDSGGVNIVATGTISVNNSI